MAYSVALLEQGLLSTGPGTPEHPPQSGTWPEKAFNKMRWARVRITTDTTSYATGGLALNVLAALTGWRQIGDWYSQRVGWSGTDWYAQLSSPNHATTGSRLCKILKAADDTEYGNTTASEASVFDMWLVGW